MERLRRDDLTSALNCSLLRTFVRVAETGSMTRAAESLFLAQSAVSTQVASLSSLIGAPLLERRAGRFVPTAAGEVLLEEARQILTRVAMLERRLRDVAGDDGRRVAVACTRTVCETAVARVVALFRQAHPELSLAVGHGTLRDVELRLRSGESDVALLEGAPPLADVRSDVFHVDRLLLAVPAGHPLAKRPSVRFEDAARHPFVLRSASSGTRLLIEQRLGRRFEQLSIALELEGNAEIVAAVEGGVGLTFLSETALANARALGTIVALELEGVDLSREFSVVIPQTRPLPEAARVFADWLATQYPQARLRALASA